MMGTQSEADKYEDAQYNPMSQESIAYSHGEMQSHIYNARHAELQKLEAFLTEHILDLETHYSSINQPTAGDTIAYYTSRTMCEKFRADLHKMHKHVTEEQFIYTTNALARK